MDSIPLELTDAIVDELETKADFLACRLVCKTLKALATSRAFRVINLVPNEEIIQVVQGLVARPDLSFHIKEIVYRDRENRKFDNVEAVTRTASCFLHLSKFENLESLHFKFPGDRCSRSGFHGHKAARNKSLQTAIFKAIGTSPPPKKLRCLEIVGILALPHYSVHFPGFAKFLEPIQTLRLAVASDRSADYQSVYGIQFFNGFWMNDIPVFLKSPTSLTTLMIFTDRDHLFPDYATWDNLSFPNLSTLKLRRICFYGPPDTGAEGFIVRHAATLTKLEINACMIANYDHDPNPKTSADVLHHFQAKLKNLKEFTVIPTPGQIPDPKIRDINIKYLSHLLGGQGYKCSLDHNQDRGTDVYVYESLQDTIKSRRRLE